MDSNTLFSELQKYWFKQNCEDEFSIILEDPNLEFTEKEIRSLDYLRDTFYSFLKENNQTEITPSTIEVMLNWSIIMYLQIKERENGNAGNI